MSYKGRRFEQLMAVILNAAGFKVKTNVKTPFTELDIIAFDPSSGQRIGVECKDTLPELIDFRDFCYKIAANEMKHGVFATTHPIGSRKRKNMQQIIEKERERGHYFILIDSQTFDRQYQWILRKEEYRLTFWFRKGLQLARHRTMVQLDRAYPYHPEILEYIKPIKYLIEQGVSGEVETGAYDIVVIDPTLDTRLDWHYSLAELSCTSDKDTAITYEEEDCFLIRVSVMIACPRCLSDMKRSFDVGFSRDIFNGTVPVSCEKGHSYEVRLNLKTLFAIKW